MGSGGSGVWFRGFMGSVLAVSAIACAPKTPPQATAPVAPAPAPVGPLAAASDELPDAPGKRILTGACVACHALREVTKFRGFYTRPQWRDIVLTMVDYGASVGEKDVEVLTDYLTEQLGKK